MIALSHSEAILFRMLAGFFGKDRIAYGLSLMAVCGGELPTNEEAFGGAKISADMREWAKRNKCLFTVTDHDDNPKLVVEFFSDRTDAIDAEALEHQQFMKPLLQAKGVRYITISDDEFAEITDPRGHMGFFDLLRAKVEQSQPYSLD